MYATVVHLVCAATVVAQSYTEAPPKEGLEQKGSAFEWLLVAAFLVGTLVVAFKPAKRVNLR
jgi:hypothetical protein